MNRRDPNHYRLLLLMLAVLVGVSVVRSWWAVALLSLQILFLAIRASRLQKTAQLTAGQQHAEEVHRFVLLTLAALVGISAVRGWWVVTLLTFQVFFLALRAHQLRRAAQLAGERQRATELAELHMRTTEALALAINAKDNTTHQHLERVVAYCAAIGREIGLPKDELEALQTAALLHDIGKLAVPEYIISKPGRLTEEEFEKVKIHTVVGADILERVKFPYPVVPIVRSHHERWDGSGYPDGLKGHDIPIGARILAVVDSFDALSTDRPYRRALLRGEALAVIRGGAGALYDPKVVEALEKLFPVLETLAPHPRSETPLPTKVRVERGHAPGTGLSEEKGGDTGAAFFSIAQAQEEMQVLYQLTQALGSSLSVADTLRRVAQELQKLVEFDAIAIYLLQGGELIPRFVDGVNAALLARTPIPLGEGLSGWVAGNGKCSLNGNPSVEPAYLQDPHEFSKLRCALSAPLDSRKGIIGALTLYSMRPNAFTVDNLRVLKAVGMKVGSAADRALVHEAIGKSAATDDLTGLPNARALLPRLEQELARAARESESFSVFVVDVDSLKEINDTHGHLVGNKVLKGVAAGLRGCVREYDFVARVGGDEFILLLPRTDPRSAATKCLELALAVKDGRSDCPREISISVGSATYPDDGQDAEKLITLADQRMYHHKHDGPRSQIDKLAARIA